MSNRRYFLRTSLLGAAALGPLRRVQPPSAAPLEPAEPWLEGLTGQHKQFFDVQSIRNGAPLKRVGNFLDAYASAYHLRDSQVNAIFGAHVDAVSIALDDAAWATYDLGAALSPASRTNPYRAQVEALQRRDVRFLACNNSLQALATSKARAGGPSAAAIHDALVKAVLPGVTVVPAMVVAINRAQEAGLTYACLP